MNVILYTYSVDIQVYGYKTILEERIEIKQLHRNCKQRKHADKLKAILMLDDGFSCVDVSKVLLLDDDAVRCYRKTYLSKGATVLLTDNNKGSVSFLNSKQLEALEKHLMTNTYMDLKELFLELRKNLRLVTHVQALMNS